MPERVAVHRIVVGGEEKSRRVIEAGKRFNTEEYKISAEELEKLDRRRATREPRDQPREGAREGVREDDGGPRANSRMGRVVEGRSGPAHDVTNPTPGYNEPPGRVLSEPADNRDLATRREQARIEPAAPATEPHETRRTRRSDTDL